MWLTLDIGNSAAKGGLYEGPSLETVFHLDLTRSALRDASALEAWVEQLTLKLDGLPLHRAGMASVVPALEEPVRSALATHTGTDPLIIAPTLHLPFEMVYETPDTLGTDRLAGAVAAWDQFGAPEDMLRPVVAIDAGTAITYDIVTPPGTYRGGAIAPGPALLRRALHEGTAQLPDVPLDVPASIIGQSTRSSIQAGIMSALVDSVQGMITRIERELETDPVVVVTGGWRTLLHDHLSAIDHVAPHLVLDGIRLLMELNLPEDT